MRPKINKVKQCVYATPPPPIFFKEKANVLLDYLKNTLQYTFGADKNCLIPHLYEISIIVKFIESESTLVDTRGRIKKKANGWLVVKWNRVSV